MRHRNSGRQLNRNSSHRKAMFRNMAVSLFDHEVIRTTLPKAKELRRVAEPLITLAKEDSVANRRVAFSRIRDKAAVGKLFVDLGPRYKERPGGYMRILKCGYRPGDKAPMAYVELVDRPDVDNDRHRCACRRGRRNDSDSPARCNLRAVIPALLWQEIPAPSGLLCGHMHSAPDVS